MSLELMRLVIEIDGDQISVTERMVLTRIANDIFDDSDASKRNLTYIAKALGMGRTTLYTTIKSLKRLNLVEELGKNRHLKINRAEVLRRSTYKQACSESEHPCSESEPVSFTSLYLPLQDIKQGPVALGSVTWDNSKASSKPLSPAGEEEQLEAAALAKSKLKPGEYPLSEVNSIAAKLPKTKAKQGNAKLMLKIAYRDWLINICGQAVVPAFTGAEHGMFTHYLKKCQGDGDLAMKQMEIVMSNWEGFRNVVLDEVGVKIGSVPHISQLVTHAQCAINFTGDTHFEKEKKSAAHSTEVQAVKDKGNAEVADVNAMDEEELLAWAQNYQLKGD